jgi:hypothetical protein
MNWSASTILRSENPKGRRLQAKNYNEGLAPNPDFGEDQRCHTLDLLPLAGAPARPLGGSSCFWVLVAPNQAEESRPYARKRLSKVSRVNAGTFSVENACFPYAERRASSAGRAASATSLKSGE